jgi:hypothetical protein
LRRQQLPAVRFTAIGAGPRGRLVLDRRRVGTDSRRGRVDTIRQRVVFSLPRGCLVSNCRATRGRFGSYGIRTITGFLLQPLNTSISFVLNGLRARILLGRNGLRTGLRFGSVTVDAILRLLLDG